MRLPRARHALLAFALAFTGQAAFADAKSCESLAGFADEKIVSISAEMINDGTFTPEGAEPLGNLPALCRVSIIAAPEIGIEVWLPENWNGRFRGTGGGGYAGAPSWPSLAAIAAEGYAVASTDTGHKGNGGDGSFAYNADGTLDLAKVEVFASTGIFEMTRLGKAVTAAYYDEPASYSYWTGCSTGGRQGLMQVQRTPDAYDGVIAGAPAINWDRFIASEIWPQLVMNEMFGAPIPQCKFDLAIKTAMSECDGNDGVTDGIVSDFQSCEPTLSVARCAADTPPDCDCLTEQEVTAIQRIWQGPVDANGQVLWSGLSPVAPNQGLAGEMAFPIAVEHAKWVMDDRNFDWTSLTTSDFATYFAKAQDRLNAVIGTDNPDLALFRDAGGKLMIWHGTDDELIVAEGSIDYYERVAALNDSIAATQDFARLFLAPGMLHCFGGNAPIAFGSLDNRAPGSFVPDFDASNDIFTALVAWVEEDRQPEQIVATQFVDGDPAKGVARTRPLCSWPARAVYDGTSDPDQASSFTCE